MTDIQPVIKRCGDCDHGREKINAQTLKRQVICKALPPVMVAMPVQTPQGPAMNLRGYWPTMEPDEECDYFCPKSPHN